jgi:RNA polymerase sigma-70 factor (ECF subfamily)
VSDEDFRALYAQLQQAVFSFAARRLSPEQAMDVVNSTFEVVLRKRHACPARPEEWAPWVMGIARNQVLQEGQRVTRKHHDNRFIEDYADREEPVNPDVAEVVADTEYGRWVWRSLEPSEQRLMTVAFVQLLSTADGARLMGISTSAYTTRVLRLRRRLEALEAEHLGTPILSVWGERA